MTGPVVKFKKERESEGIIKARMRNKEYNPRYVILIDLNLPNKTRYISKQLGM